MGVPAFFRWLSERYPKIMVDCVEEEPEVIGATEVPVDITQPNPNNVELDNLYLDMNGIIHPCFHPEDKPAPKSETEVFLNIFEYIDRLVALVRPRKVVYMAIDGVAPRAKMNQQRSRRFRAAADREEQKQLEAQLRKEFKAEGINLPEPTGDGDTFDSNVITPGTDFMDRLSMVLQWYVHKRMNDNPGWRNLSVVLSDANTPGEGEHKFMQFVREQRGRPGWNGNTTHCVYGLDADLIHLALAAHEPHFYILREVVFPPKHCNQDGPSRSRAVATVRGDQGKQNKPQVAKKPFQLLQIGVLREYLLLEFSDLQLPFNLDQERVVDDFVFMCFFVGNDFLPHMPTLDIREKGIELMLSVYRQVLPDLGGYLADGADLHLERVGRFIAAVGQYEDKIFQARMRKMRADKNRFLSQKFSSNGGSRQVSEPNGSNHIASERTGDGSNDRVQLNSKDPKHFLASTAGNNSSNHGENGVELQTRWRWNQPKYMYAVEKSNKDAASSLRQRLRASATNGSVPGAMPATLQNIPAQDNDANMESMGGIGREHNHAVYARKRSLERDGDQERPRKASCSAEMQDVAAEPTASGADPGQQTQHDTALQMWDDLGAGKAATTGSPAAGEDPAVNTEDTCTADMDDAEADQQMEEKVAIPVDSSKETADKYKAKLKNILKNKADMFEDMVQHEEVVRLGDDGWKARYYEQKFGITEPSEQADLAKKLCHAYVEGLCWVMRYYFDGVASWTWYYPFHYAPFASDLVNLGDLQISFETGRPFAPFNQLMGVLPAGSKHALPKQLQPLFDDENSPILDFYPKDFKVDMNGKRFAWQGVALLPFIDEQRLLEATGPIINQLPEEEKRRNQQRLSILLAHKESPAGSMIVHQSQNGAGGAELLLPTESVGYSGEIRPCAGSACPQVFPKPACASVGPDIIQNSVCMALYSDPPHIKHTPKIMPETELPQPVLTSADRPREEPLWCERHGLRMNNRNGYKGSVGGSGRRMVQHHLPHPPGRGGRPPPRYPTRPPPHGNVPFHYRPPPPAFSFDAHAQPFVQQMQAGHVPAQMPAQQFAAPYATYVVVQQPQQQQPQHQPGSFHGSAGAQWVDPSGAGVFVGHGQAGMYGAGPQVAPGHAGSLFGSMRPAPAMGPQGGVHVAAGPWSHAPGNQPYGGGGYGRGGHSGQAGRYGGTSNRFAALRDPRSRR